MQIGFLFGAGQPLPAIVPVAQCALRRFQAFVSRFRQAIQLGIGFDAIAHALDQQAQTMAVMGGIVQRFVEFLPLLAQAFFDAFTQILEQALTLGRAQKSWKRVENHQQRSQFRTRRQRRIRLGHLRQTPLRSLGLIMLEQIRREHFAITPRCGQIAHRRSRRLQLLDSRQATQRPQQTAQAPHRSAQIMQRLRISARSQARLTCQQPHIQAQNMSHQAIDHGGLLRRTASSCKLQASS